MEIIQKPTSDNFVQKYECVCSECGCRFVAEHSEYKAIEKRIDGRIWFECPECGTTNQPIDRKGWQEPV